VLLLRAQGGAEETASPSVSLPLRTAVLAVPRSSCGSCPRVRAARRCGRLPRSPGWWRRRPGIGGREKGRLRPLDPGGEDFAVGTSPWRRHPALAEPAPADTGSGSSGQGPPDTPFGPPTEAGPPYGPPALRSTPSGRSTPCGRRVRSPLAVITRGNAPASMAGGRPHQRTPSRRRKPSGLATLRGQRISWRSGFERRVFAGGCAAFPRPVDYSA